MNGYETAANRAVTRWSGLVAWAFSSSTKPRTRRAALYLAKLAINAEWQALAVRQFMGFAPPRGVR